MDEASELLSACLDAQKAAGFGRFEDRRTVHCPTCNAPGHNTGWGYWAFACGAEILSDGVVDEPCPREASP